jgi:RHS repeat-associated protein
MLALECWLIEWDHSQRYERPSKQMKGPNHSLVQSPRPSGGRRPVHSGRSDAFRKACRGSLRPQLLEDQILCKDSRTCLEGPFGELLRATGPMAKANPFRFSTKYQDDETDLLYYGYRYYDPSTGRWKSRDPIAEQAGAGLYIFLNQDALNNCDAFGLVDTARLTATQQKIKDALANQTFAAKLPLAVTLLDRWFRGLGDWELPDSDVATIFSTPQAKDAMSRQLGYKILRKCALSGLAPGEKRDVVIKFDSWPNKKISWSDENNLDKAAMETFGVPGILSGVPTEKDLASWDAATAMPWNLFLAFNNIFFGAEYSGQCCRDETGSSYSFKGDVDYKVFDRYVYNDNGLLAVAIAMEKPSGFPSDSDMWYYQENGSAIGGIAKPFMSTGHKKVSGVSVTTDKNKKIVLNPSP